MNNKIELFRQSKAPIEISDYELYQKEWTAFYDKVMEKYGTNYEHMERVEALLNRKEIRLIKKYNKPIWIDLPTNTEQFEALCEKYGAPIMIAQRMDKKGAVAIIMDELS